MTIHHIDALAGMSFREVLAAFSDQLQVGDQIRVSWPDGLRESAEVRSGLYELPDGAFLAKTLDT